MIQFYVQRLLETCLDRKLPENAVHAAECLLHAKKKSAALDVLLTLLDESVALPIDTQLRHKAEAWVSLLAPEKEHG